VLTGMPAMTAEQVVVDRLIKDLDGHFGSIRKTVGGEGANGRIDQCR